MSTTPLRRLAVPALLLGALALAACGNDSKSADTTTTTTTTTSSTTTTAVTTTTTPDQQQSARFDKAIQAELAAVGCYKGNIDGILGPQSDAAILAFQRASGLAADGELGPNTEKALSEAAAAKKTVCQASTTTTTAKPATTTTFAPNDAPCTATAILGGLPAEGEKVTSFVCAGPYAAGSLDNGAKFILKAQNGKWYAPSTDPCGGASAGLPPVILENGCGG
ncbi:MAG: peptidoglycan-binding domain-containing protein [Microthrixaceae bacterium]